MKRLLFFFAILTFEVSADDFKTQEFALINEVINYAKKHSAKEDIKDEDITAGMLKGALQTIDTHSTYFTKDEYKKLQESLDGKFSGIGVYIELHEGLVRVTGVIKGMPAEKAGVKNGDYITHIDGNSTFGFSLEEASSKLRGKKKTKVKLGLLRKGEDKPVEVVVTRDDITIETVSMKIVNNILLIQLNYFNEHTFEEFVKLLEQQKEYKGIVLDVRSNPGGVLDGAIGIASLFVQKGETIVQVSNVEDMKKPSEKDCVGSKKRCRNIFYEAHDDKIAVVNDHKPVVDVNIPIVVLTNSYSASASEITALAIQENNRGFVVGQKTFGKGSVQTILPLYNGDRGALKLTTALYYSPKGNSIQAEGVQPDISVPEFIVTPTEKRNSFFPKSEAENKNHIIVGGGVEKYEEVLSFEEIEDFALQTAIASLRTSIIQNANKHK